MPYDAWYEDHAAGLRSRARPDAQLAAERAAPGGEPEHAERLDGPSPTLPRRSAAYQMVNLANGILRHRFGVKSVGRAIERSLLLVEGGAAEGASRQTGWVKQQAP